MRQIFNFIIGNKTFLLFLLLFAISVSLTIQSHSYHKSKFINSANNLTGGVYGSFQNISQYFGLKKDNDILAEENRRLRQIITNIETESDSVFIDTSRFVGRYKFTKAEVYKNSYSRPNNYLTINKGRRDSIKRDLGVITSNGVVGIIDNTSNKYATVISILNKTISINAELKNTDHQGSLKWDTESPEYVQLTDLLKFAPIKVGDTIITGGQSSIFPKGINIGTVESFTLDSSGDTYTVQVKLFNDMTSVGHVYIIENMDAEEIRSLEALNNE